MGDVAALSKPRFWRTPRVPSAFGRKAEGTGNAPSWRPSNPNSRTHGSISRAAKPSDVITSVSFFVSVRPSGSRLSRRERLSIPVAERGDGGDLNGGSAVRDADPERVEARADLVVGERVEDMPAGVVGDAGESAEGGAVELGRGREDLLPEELELRRRRGLRRRDRHKRDREQHDESRHTGPHPGDTVLRHQVDREGNRQHDGDKRRDGNLHAAEHEPRCSLAPALLRLGDEVLGLLDWISHIERHTPQR